MRLQDFFLSILFYLTVTENWAAGHSGPHPNLSLGWDSWTWPPLVVISLFLLSVIYLLGAVRMQRSRRGIHRSMIRQVGLFYLGVLFAGIALVSPIDALSDVLGWVHMIQHTLLMMVAAPLFVAGSPGHIFLWAIPRKFWKHLWPYRYLIKKILSSSRFSWPMVSSAIYAFTLWILHTPTLYEKALKTEWVHDLQHIAFFSSSFLFWRVVLDPFLKNKLSPGVGILYLFVTSNHAMILGVLMALSPHNWYPSYELTTPHYGFTALEDQQIAGYIMWMPAGVSFVVVAIVLLLQIMRTESNKPSTSTLK